MSISTGLIPTPDSTLIHSGGAGAGPDWEGQNCVHVHMTNVSVCPRCSAHRQTAIGDVEMTERVYPVIIHEFSRRKNSQSAQYPLPHKEANGGPAGGNGRHRGGDGCIRDIEFTEDLDVAILSQRRVIPPYGMAGGEPGAVGANVWYKGTKDGKHTIINLGGCNQAKMKKGDHIVISERDPVRHRCETLNLPVCRHTWRRWIWRSGHCR